MSVISIILRWSPITQEGHPLDNAMCKDSLFLSTKSVFRPQISLWKRCLRAVLLARGGACHLIFILIHMARGIICQKKTSRW